MCFWVFIADVVPFITWFYTITITVATIQRKSYNRIVFV